MTQGISYRTVLHPLARPSAAVAVRPHRVLAGLRRFLGLGRDAALPAGLVRDADPDLHAATTELTSAWQRLDGHLRPSLY